MSSRTRFRLAIRSGGLLVGLVACSGGTSGDRAGGADAAPTDARLLHDASRDVAEARDAKPKPGADASRDASSGQPDGGSSDGHVDTGAKDAGPDSSDDGSRGDGALHDGAFHDGSPHDGAGLDGSPVDAGHDAARDALPDVFVVPPTAFAPGQVDVDVAILTSQGRTPISPLIYGINSSTTTGLPPEVLASVTMTRRGGDRGNTYNWETNVSNGGIENGYGSDMTLATGLPNPSAPAGQDLYDLAQNRAGGRTTMVPFVMNNYVAGPVDSNIPWDVAGWNIGAYFNQELLVKSTPYAMTPDLTDGVVYADEQLAFMRAQFADDITLPGPTQILVGLDNEPDLWEYNFPMLQRGSGAALTASNDVVVGNRVTGPEFTQEVITFTTKVKAVAPMAHIVGPAHFGYDGWECWHDPTQTQWSDLGRWFMDDFLESVSAASQAAGVRLLDTWDFHWYPQATFDGTAVSALDNAVSPLTDAEIDAIVQGPRSYWDTTYDEGSWITSMYHLNGPAYVLTRLQGRILADYPGTGLGVTEYFPGGLNHISSGLAVVDSLGVFQRMGIELAAMWPLGDNTALAYAFGGIELVRNADGNGLRFADTAVLTSNPDTVDLSVYAGMDTPGRVTVLVVNKTQAALNVGLSLTNAAPLSTVAIYRIDAADPSPYLAETLPVTLYNAYPYVAPALSASMLVFESP